MRRLELDRDLSRRYGLTDVRLTRLDTLVNDVFAVSSAQGEFALKVYRRGRTREAVRWEVDLVRHLQAHGAPVVQPVRGAAGDVQHLTVAGVERLAVLYPWAAGAKPAASAETYTLLGTAAARIHTAADGLADDSGRRTYGTAELVDEPLRRMRPFLEPVGRWRPALALGDRLKARLTDPGLDRGICHLDLTLDNVHVDGTGLTVFDFDRAGTCWRAAEPWGVRRFSRTHFETWLAAYRTVRRFSAADEAAVATFGIVGDLEVVAWKLGAGESSLGTPLLTTEDLPAVVDGWLAWEATELA